MRKVILAVLLFIFISPAFAAEQSDILLGLKWGDSEDTVHKKMQELNLALYDTEEIFNLDPILLYRKKYTGEVSGISGSIDAHFKNDQLVGLDTIYDCEKPVAKNILDDLTKALIEKHESPQKVLKHDFTHIEEKIWELESLNMRINLISMSSIHDNDLIMLTCTDLKFYYEINQIDKE